MAIIGPGPRYSAGVTVRSNTVDNPGSAALAVPM